MVDWMHMRYILPLLALVLAACDSQPSTRPPVQPAGAAGRGVVDSIFPIEEEIRRFQATLADTARELTGGESSRDALVTAFMRALERGDTAAFAPMAVGVAEFGYLYFPESRFTAKPYKTKPGLLWGQIQNGSARGINRAFQRFGGQALGFQGYECSREPVEEGLNRLWEGCAVTIRPAGADSARTLRLFGGMLERDGRWKFLSYANDL
jgi:hypothetical protein